MAQETEGLCSHCHHMLAEARNKVLFTEPMFITCPLVLWGGRTHAALHSWGTPIASPPGGSSRSSCSAIMTIIIDGDLSRPVLAKAEGLLPHAFAAASHMPPLSSRRELGKKSAGRGTGEPHLLEM